MTPWAPWTTQPARPLCPWGFSRQEYWSGFPCLSPEDLPNPGIKPRLPTLWVQSLKPLYLFIIFISIALGDWPRKTLVWFMSENVLPVFFSRSFIMSCVIFKSLSHFEFLCMMWGSVLTSVIYMQLSSFPNTTFSCCIFLLTLSKINSVGVYPGLSILFHWSSFLFLHQYRTVWITIFVTLS